jgi:hypothetical protein
VVALGLELRVSRMIGSLTEGFGTCRVDSRPSRSDLVGVRFVGKSSDAAVSALAAESDISYLSCMCVRIGANLTDEHRLRHGFKICDPQPLRMTTENEPSDPSTEEEPRFLSSLPDQPITDNIVKQIGESNHPKIRGAMGFPGSTPGTIEAFLLDMEAKTFVLVFDPIKERWRVYESFETKEMSHQEVVDRASMIANEWLAESLSDRIAAAEESDSGRPS